MKQKVVMVAMVMIVITLAIIYVVTTSNESYTCTQDLCNRYSAGNTVTLQCDTSPQFGDQSCCDPNRPDLVPTCDDSGSRCSCCPPGYWIDPADYDAASETCMGYWFSFYGGNSGSDGTNWQCCQGCKNGSYCKPPVQLSLGDVKNLSTPSGTVRGAFPANYASGGIGSYVLHCEMGAGVVNNNSTVTFPNGQTWTITTLNVDPYYEDVTYLSRVTRPSLSTYKKLDFAFIRPS